jgi:hypothetical protein
MMTFHSDKDEDKGVDMVNSPPHYMLAKCKSCGSQIETRDIQEAIVEPLQGMLAHDIACAFKYLSRFTEKGGSLDLGKCGFYVKEAEAKVKKLEEEAQRSNAS